MSDTRSAYTEVWAQIYLRREDEDRLTEFFCNRIGIHRRFVVRGMHITVYHARRRMPGLREVSEETAIRLPAHETRFMVMAPGGENPRNHLDPANRKIGVRMVRNGIAMPPILQLRARLLKFETRDVLGSRLPSDSRRNAFGAHHFQPHLSVLMPGSGVDRDLTKIGVPFRNEIGDLTFNRFRIEIVGASS